MLACRLAHEKPARRLVDQRGRRYRKLNKFKQTQMQSTYWFEKVLKMISLYVNALLCTLQHIVCHTREATQRSQFSELTPLSCIACMTICCSVHKSALTYKEIIFSTFSNQ